MAVDRGRGHRVNWPPGRFVPLALESRPVLGAAVGGPFRLPEVAAERTCDQRVRVAVRAVHRSKRMTSSTTIACRALSQHRLSQCGETHWLLSRLHRAVAQRNGTAPRTALRRLPTGWRTGKPGAPFGVVSVWWTVLTPPRRGEQPGGRTDLTRLLGAKSRSIRSLSGDVYASRRLATAAALGPFCGGDADDLSAALEAAPPYFAVPTRYTPQVKQSLVSSASSERKERLRSLKNGPSRK